MRPWKHRVSLLLVLAMLPAQAVAWRLTQVHPVTPAGEFFMAPSWSPDGSSVAVTRQKYSGILIADPTGRRPPAALVDLPGAGFGFAWSMDGREILFRRATDTGPGAQNPRRLARATLGNPGKVSDEGPLPLLGISQRIPSPGRGPHAYVDAGERVWLERDGSATLLSERAGYYDPMVSPALDRVLAHHRNGHLYLMSLDSSKPVDLGEGYAAAWSPDGAYILFNVSRDDGHFITSSELFIVRAGGSFERRQITD